MRRLPVLVALLGALVGCDDAGATVEISDARAYRDAERRIVVDVDLAGMERLGGRVGRVCLRVTFAGQTDPREVCRDDLEDGGIVTTRFVSDAALGPRATITLRARLGTVDVGRSLVGPE